MSGVRVEVRDDGARVVWDGNQGVMLTAASGGRVIFVTGSGDDHPFDTCPAVLGPTAVQALIAALGAIA